MGNVKEWVNAGAPGIAAECLNEPFHIRSATWNSAPNQLEVVIGPGRVDFTSPGVEKLGAIDYATTVTVTLATPSASTVYYVFVKASNNSGISPQSFMSASDFRISTSALPLSSEVRIGRVKTNTTYGAVTERFDLRGILPAPAGGLVRLDRQVLGASAATITIPSSGSLSGDFSSLRIRVMGRGDNAATFIGVRLTCNGDGGVNQYVSHWLLVNGATVTASGPAASTYAVAGDLPANNATAGVSGVVEIIIPVYAGTTFHKTFRARSTVIADDSSNSYMREAAGRWKSTSAVTSVGLALSAGNFISGTTVTTDGEV